jgi:Domain of unknown function (DUF4386)
MNLASSNPNPNRAAQPSRALAVLLALEALLSFAPVAIMAPAFGWPGSLDEPAAQQLSNLLAHPQAVIWGYGLYLLYSMLIAAVGVAVAARWGGGLGQTWASAAAAFMALSALARSVGILRWLTVMPVLAAAHAAGDPAARAQTEALFDAVHAYGGGIGEVLGVSLFMGLGLIAWAVAARQASVASTGFIALGVLVALLLLALSAPVLGVPEFMPVALAVSMLSLWMAVGAVLAWRGR